MQVFWPLSSVPRGHEQFAPTRLPRQLVQLLVVPEQAAQNVAHGWQVAVPSSSVCAGQLQPGAPVLLPVHAWQFVVLTVHPLHFAEQAVEGGRRQERVNNKKYPGS